LYKIKKFHLIILLLFDLPEKIQILSLFSAFTFNISRYESCNLEGISMKILWRRLIFTLTVSASALLVAITHLLTSSPGLVQANSPPPNDSPVQSERPFRLPFARPPGPATWLLAQPYGNTTGAYSQRYTTYGASGGIHFGVDLAAACGTEIVAIADGVVFAVDGPFGSPPHNLMIDHPQLDYASMYGHLLQTPNLRPGTVVKKGQVVALVGDSSNDCTRRPHLHLEIRDLKHVRKYNPVMLIEANWDNLALTGNSGRDFMHDLAEPRKWQTLYDQPEARTGGPIVNDFANTWPLDWSQRTSTSAAPGGFFETTPAQTQTPITTPLLSWPSEQQITSGNCCTQPYWNKESTEVRFLDQPSPDKPLGIWGVDLAQSETGPHLVTERLGIYSPDGSLIAYPDRNRGGAIIERLADGEQWEIDTQESRVTFTLDSQGLLWVESDQDAPSDSREETIWLAEVDGSNARAVFSARRTGIIAWLSDDELLMSRSQDRTSTTQLFTLSLKDGVQTELMEVPRMRGMTLNPDQRYLVYYASFEAEAEQNGVWLIDLQNPTQAPQKLSFFGTYRWRDPQRLIYIPLDSDATSHDFYEYNILTRETRPLFPAGTNLIVANNDWQVSPDGRKIALVAAKGTELDGIWVIEIDEN
jgi:hypothetical protein